MPEERTYVQFQTFAGTCHMRIHIIAPDTFRVRLCANEDFPESALVRYGIIRFPATAADYTVTEDGDWMAIRTEKAVLQASRTDGRIALSYLRQSLSVNHTPPDAERGFCAQLRLSRDERLYGLGDESRETIMKRGRMARIHPLKPVTQAPIPFLMSSLGWGLFINTTRKHEIDIGCTDPDRLSFSLSGTQLDYILYTGSGYAELLNKYTDTTGKPELLPIWAYGFTFICNQQANAREAIEDGLKFRREDIPCDTFGLESNWMEKHYDRSTTKNWHPGRFYIPDWSPKGQHTFIGTLAGMGFKLSLWLSCDYDLSAYEEQQLRQTKLRSADGDDSAAVSDSEHGNGEAWYEHLMKFVDQGVKAFKLSESNIARDHSARRWGNGMTIEEMELLYPLLLSKQMYNGFKQQTGLRPMIYSAESYAGIQQYAALWTGGMESEKEYRTLITILNDGLSGLSNVTNDMNIHTPSGIHFGLFQPWCKVNSWAYWRHPCLLESRLRTMFKHYAKLRYRLLPYIYSAAHTAARTGMPIVRAMPLMYPHDTRMDNMLTQYMFGDAFMVAAFTVRVSLPEGAWIDYWTGERHSGPKELEYDVPDHVGGPLFVRAGAIIPMWPEMDYVGQKPVARMSLHIYPQGDSDYTLYEDDGTTFGYSTGEVASTTFSCESNERQTVVRIGRRIGQYAGMPDKRSYDTYIYTNTKPSRITVNGETYKETAQARKMASSPSWVFDRLSGCTQLYIEESGTVQIEIAHGTEKGRDDNRPRAGRAKPNVRASGDKTQSSPLSANPMLMSGPPDGEKQLEIGLERGDWDKTSNALELLLKERVDAAGHPDEVRENFLYMSGLLVRFLDSKGWPMKEVIGENYKLFLGLQTMSAKEEGRALLLQVAEQVTAYSRNARNASVHPLVQRLMEMVNKSIDQQFFKLSDAAERLHVNSSHLSRLFKQETGTSFSDYVMEKKMNYAKQLLQGGCKVADAAVSTGFRDTGYFIRVFRKYWGVTPGELKL